MRQFLLLAVGKCGEFTPIREGIGELPSVQVRGSHRWWLGDGVEIDRSCDSGVLE
jgi:hypothetical protein